MILYHHRAYQHLVEVARPCPKRLVHGFVFVQHLSERRKETYIRTVQLQLFNLLRDTNRYLRFMQLNASAHLNIRPTWTTYISFKKRRLVRRFSKFKNLLTVFGNSRSTYNLLHFLLNLASRVLITFQTLRTIEYHSSCEKLFRR